jgi:hypothetical protein
MKTLNTTLKYLPLVAAVTAALAWSHTHGQNHIESGDTATMEALTLAVETQAQHNRKADAELEIMKAKFDIDRLRKKEKAIGLDADDKDFLNHQIKLRDIYQERLLDAEKKTG